MNLLCQAEATPEVVGWGSAEAGESRVSANEGCFFTPGRGVKGRSGSDGAQITALY